MAEILFPIQGEHRGFPASKQPPNTAYDLNNVRPFKDGRMRGGQRPALKKLYSQQIGGAAMPIVELLSITVIV